MIAAVRRTARRKSMSSRYNLVDVARNSVRCNLAAVACNAWFVKGRHEKCRMQQYRPRISEARCRILLYFSACAIWLSVLCGASCQHAGVAVTVDTVIAIIFMRVVPNSTVVGMKLDAEPR